MRVRAAFVMSLVFSIAGIPLVAAARASEAGGKDVSVALFSATRVRAVTLTALGATTWIAKCATCEHRSFASPQTFSGPGELFAGGALRVTDTVSGAQRSAVGLWHIKAITGTLDVVLTLPSERYVDAVLSAETAANEPAESLRAMAIVARTYALNGTHYAATVGHLKADLCDSTACQAARFGPQPAAIEEAVRSTAGETLWFGRRRAEVFFSQSCGGTTEDARAASLSMRSTSYLNQHADPFCLRRSASAWHTEIKLTDLQAIGATQGWRMPGEIDAVEIVKRSAAHRTVLLQFAGRTGVHVPVSASALRLAVGRALGWNKVRSDWYDVGVRNGALIFDGRGFGHGVGLCQLGATEMAAERKSSREVLAFYFPGTRIGVGPGDAGWSSEHLSGVDVRSVRHLNPSQRESIEAAWRQARTLFVPRTSITPEIIFAPSVELFRQMTSQPGWTLASTSGARIVLQPPSILGSRATSTLRHEMLHVLVESEASAKAPLWLREGLVEVLDGEVAGAAMSDAAMEAELSHPTTREASQQTHRAAARRVQALIARYGMARVRSWLALGVPPVAN